MTNIHLVGGEKGGVGKSLLARLLAQYFIDHSLPFIGFDSDRTHGALMRFYAGYASPILMDNYESLDTIVEAATEEPGRRILVDLAAQTNEGLTQWMEDSQLLEVAPEIGLSMRYWHVMDSGRDSVDLLKRLLDKHGTRFSYTLVLNQVRGGDFRILDNSGDIKWELDQLKGLKHPHDDPKNAGTERYLNGKMTLTGPSVENLLHDAIYANFEITWQYNGHSLGNITINPIQTNDAVAWGLAVKALINDDANVYPSKSGGECSAIQLRFTWVFDRVLFSDKIYITDFTLRGDGTWDHSGRWTQ